MFAEKWWAETKIFLWLLFSFAVGIGVDQIMDVGPS